MAELVRKLHLCSGGLLEGVATFSEDDPGGGGGERVLLRRGPYT